MCDMKQIATFYISNKINMKGDNIMAFKIDEQ